MKKIFKPLLILLILALLLSLAVAGAGKLLHKSLAQALEQAGISVGQIEFSLWRGNLDLQRIELHQAAGLPQARVERVQVLGFNWRSLLRKDSDVLPLVADAISVQGLELRRTAGQAEPDFSCVEIYLEGWRQSLGKLAELAEQSVQSRAFFEELLSYRIEVLALREPVLSWDFGQGDQLRARAAFIGLLQPAGSVTRYPDAGRNLALFANELLVYPLDPDAFATQSFGFQRLEIRDLLLPPADDLTALAALNGEPKELGAWLDRVYHDQPPYQSVMLDNCAYAYLDDLGNKRVLVAEQVTQTISQGQSPLLTLDIYELTDNLTQIDPVLAQALTKLNNSGKLDLQLRLDLNFTPQALSDATLQIQAPGLLTADCVGQFSAQAAGLGQLVTYPNFLLEALWWKNLGLNADLSGLLDLWIEYLALAENIDHTTAKARINATLEHSLATGSPLGQVLEPVFAQFMREPGPVQASLTAPEPVPLPILALSLTMRPDLVNFQISVNQPD